MLSLVLQPAAQAAARAQADYPYPVPTMQVRCMRAGVLARCLARARAALQTLAMGLGCGAAGWVCTPVCPPSQYRYRGRHASQSRGARCACRCPAALGPTTTYASLRVTLAG
jgi:hypothetical protein